MIRALFVGMARVAFGLAVTAFVVAGVLVWFSFRMIRRAFRAEDAPADTRTALFRAARRGRGAGPHPEHSAPGRL
jgi:hypothetical protein